MAAAEERRGPEPQSLPTLTQGSAASHTGPQRGGCAHVPGTSGGQLHFSLYTRHRPRPRCGPREPCILPPGPLYSGQAGVGVLNPRPPQPPLGGQASAAGAQTEAPRGSLSALHLALQGGSSELSANLQRQSRARLSQVEAFCRATGHPSRACHPEGCSLGHPLGTEGAREHHWSSGTVFILIP